MGASGGEADTRTGSCPQKHTKTPGQATCTQGGEPLLLAVSLGASEASIGTNYTHRDTGGPGSRRLLAPPAQPLHLPGQLAEDSTPPIADTRAHLYCPDVPRL